MGRKTDGAVPEDLSMSSPREPPPTVGAGAGAGALWVHMGDRWNPLGRDSCSPKDNDIRKRAIPSKSS
jgi:hypothetical protein